ncbi:MAG: beta-ketoacyl-[acyl-carrier-protein] synthase family protein [Candidatus Riflebacteria bacterium]|nr:beta-ketoacyl-[acyl-carrier-protein] synthase family protein [Candidatus Riflebacteria bacterium]
MKFHRVYITGAGCISANGIGLEKLLEAIRKPVSGISQIKRFDTSKLATKIAGEVDLEELSPPEIKGFGHLDRIIDSKAFLAWEAICQIVKNLPLETPLISTVGLERVDIDVLRVHRSSEKLICPEIPLLFLPGLIWQSLGFRGEVSIQSAACAASTLAIGTAYRKIKLGIYDRAMAGGVDSLIFPYGINAFNSLAALSERNDLGSKAIAPFDKNRSGTILGEGAAFLLLESEKALIDSSRKPLAEIIGFGASMDAFHPVKPRITGEDAANSMRKALTDANLKPSEIEYLNAHGTGTFHNEIMEYNAMKSIFGEHLKVLPVSSTKPFFGHLLTAAGAMEICSSLSAFTHGILPPTLNFITPDPEIPVDCIPNLPRSFFPRIIMKNSFALGGQNASIILKRPEI